MYFATLLDQIGKVKAIEHRAGLGKRLKGRTRTDKKFSQLRVESIIQYLVLLTYHTLV